MGERELVERIDRLAGEVRRLTEGRQVGWYTANSPFKFFTTPLTSTSWDGDAYSTTAKTLIDVSATFTNAAGETVPGGVKAVLVRLIARDSGTGTATATNTYYLGVSPNSTAASIAVSCWVGGNQNSVRTDKTEICPCNSDGDIYYQIAATGAGTMDCWIEVWGYAA